MRRRRPQDAAVPDWMLRAFRWSADGAGLDHMLGDRHFATREEASEAWDWARPHAWASAHRFSVPRAATVYDGISDTAADAVRSAWELTDPFDLSTCLVAVENDRASLATFEAEQPVAAAQIALFIAKRRDDLDVVERTARALAAHPGRRWERPYPNQISTARRYDSDETVPMQPGMIQNQNIH